MKKRNLIILTSILLTIILSTSYAIFVVNTNEYKASELLVSNLIYGIQIDKQNITTVTTNETKVVTIKITSLNGIDSKYSLEYRITSGNPNAKVYYLNSTPANPTGEVNKYENGSHTKEIKVVIETNSEVTVEFNVSGGYLANSTVTPSASYKAVTDKGYEVTVNISNGTVDNKTKPVEENNNLTFKITPSNGYKLDGASITGEGCPTTLTDGSLIINNVNKDMTCTVELQQAGILVADFYNKMKEQFPETIGTQRSSFSNTNTTASAYYEDGNFIESNITGADKLMDKVYYYSGAVTNNWVSFANYYWRIIRTNEDGSLRLLYAGSASAKGKTTEGYISNLKKFNETSRNTIYVGFKYGGTGSLSNNRKNSTNSTILGYDSDQKDKGSDVTLNGWYNSNIKGHYDDNAGQKNSTNHEYSDYISKTAVYCNDRGTSSYRSSGSMYYAAYDRLINNKRPSFKCGVKYTGELIESTQAKEDKFSGMNDKAKLTNPVGLITADEIVYAGGKFGTDLPSPYAYYYTNADGNSITETYYWWTMSPSDFDGGNAAVFSVFGSPQPGYLGRDHAYVSSAVRPVISLKSCVTLSNASGEVTGDKDDPFVVQPISDECAQANN